MAAKVGVRVFRRRQDGQLQLVLARALQLHVVAVVRAVIGHHRHHVALDAALATHLGQLVLDHQVRHPGAFFKTVGVVLHRVDVGFQMHVGLFRLAHHAFRFHLGRLQVNRTDFHAVLDGRFANRIFLGRSHGAQGQGGGSQQNGADGGAHELPFMQSSGQRESLRIAAGE